MVLEHGVLPATRLLDGQGVVAVDVAAHQKSSTFELMSIKGQHWMTKSDWKRSWKSWLRGTAIGFPMGVIPAGGSEIPTILSYSLERKLSQRPEEFGKGAIEVLPARKRATTRMRPAPWYRCLLSEFQHPLPQPSSWWHSSSMDRQGRSCYTSSQRWCGN